MTEHEAVNRKDEAILNKNWRENVQLSAKFKGHQLASVKMVGEYESMWDRHLLLLSVAKQRLNRLNHDVRLVHSVPYRAGPTARESTVAEIG